MRQKQYSSIEGRIDPDRHFRACDRDGSGTLDKGEFRSALSKLVKLSDKDFTSVWTLFDKDGNGFIQVPNCLCPRTLERPLCLACPARACCPRHGLSACARPPARLPLCSHENAFSLTHAISPRRRPPSRRSMRSSSRSWT